MEKLQYRLENFEGPLDLLLNLVAKNKIDIYDIPIAELLEQYMEQIDLMREADMDVASEFLEMAARYISRPPPCCQGRRTRRTRAWS